MDIRTPQSVDCSWVEAHALAQQGREPVFVPVRPFCDDRGWSIMNLLDGVLDGGGQINFSTQHPGVVKAWHRHEHQSDFWLCVFGALRAGVHREDDGATWAIVIGERNPGVLVIPPRLWHGAATVGPTNASLLYYVTHKYDRADPDEQRRPSDSVPGFPWTTTAR